MWWILKKYIIGTSLVTQWLRIRLPMQGTRVWSLFQEDPACCEATKPVSHNYWACALEPASHNYWAHVPQLLKPVSLEPMLHNKRSHCNEKPMHRNKEQPPLAATRESPRAATKTQCSQKKKKKYIIIYNIYIIYIIITKSRYRIFLSLQKVSLCPFAVIYSLYPWTWQPLVFFFYL